MQIKIGLKNTILKLYLIFGRDFLHLSNHAVLECLHLMLKLLRFL